MPLLLGSWLPACLSALQTLACSSSNDGLSAIPEPPPTGHFSTGGASGGAVGAATGGGHGVLAAGGSGGVGAAGVGGGTRVAAGCMSNSECGRGAFCRANVCACPSDEPDVCGAGPAAVCTLKLADPNNCGVCGKTCAAGATCVAGECGVEPTELAESPGCGGGVYLAIQGANLYWTEQATGKVRTMPTAGGAITDVATGQLAPSQIAVDDKGVYWVNRGDATAATSRLLGKALPLAAGEPVVLRAAAELDKLAAVAVHGGNVYYALGTEVHQLTLSAAGAVSHDIVVGVSVDYDDPQQPLAIGEPQVLAVNDTRVVWSTPLDRAAVESHTLTEVTDIKDMTGHVRLGACPNCLASGGLGIDADYAYWVDDVSILRASLGEVVKPLQTLTASPDSTRITAFAAGASNVYAATADDRIFTHSLLPPIDPNDETTVVPPLLVARAQPGVSALVLDALRLYWVTRDCHFRSEPR